MSSWLLPSAGNVLRQVAPRVMQLRHKLAPVLEVTAK